MKRYKVTIQRIYDTYFEVEAEDEFEAEQLANVMFDDLEIRGNEMYNNQTEVEELE